VKAAVAVPYWGQELDEDALISLRHLDAHLGRHDQFAVSPGPSLPGLGLKRFPRRYFRNPITYSHLLLTRRFYEAFAGYDYLLVYQLDCLVFRDELDEWCERGLDYVGAPWLPSEEVTWVSEPRVGNGGFSLRRLASFVEVLDLAGAYASRWVEGRTASQFEAHEDLFWSFEAVNFKPDFRIASLEEALAFSFEVAPRQAFELAGGRLPFGCHAWASYGRDFWEPHLLR
jgi:hypothetical protein